MIRSTTTVLCCTGIAFLMLAGMRIASILTSTDIAEVANKPAFSIHSNATGTYVPLRETLTRQLFSDPTSDPSKNSNKAQPDGVSKEDTGMPSLVGIIIEPPHRIAVMRLGHDIKRVRETQAIGKWTVTKIERRAAILQSGSNSRRFVLDPPTEGQ